MIQYIREKTTIIEVDMFNLQHILYMVISFGLSGVLVFFGKKYIKTDAGHDKIIRFLAVITVLIHISTLWVDFFLNAGVVEVEDNMLIPIYPCNVIMWMLVIVSAMRRRGGVVYRILSEFTCLGGIVCGFIGIFLNANFDSNPTLADYDILKGMLSHSTMLLGCIWLLSAGIVKIRMRNVLSAVCGLLVFLFDGLAVNSLFAKYGIEECNSMYLLEPPFESMPWLTTVVMGIAGVSVAIILATVYEKLVLKKKWTDIFSLSSILGDDIIKQKDTATVEEINTDNDN
jgi:hypothetical protein